MRGLFVSLFLVALSLSSGCSHQVYELDEVATYVEGKWGAQLKAQDIYSVRMGSILYELGSEKRIVIAEDKQSLICRLYENEPNSCQDVVQVEISQSDTFTDLRIYFQKDSWIVTNRNPYSSSISEPQLRIIDRSFEALINSRERKS